jgi:hypothetical protein
LAQKFDYLVRHRGGQRYENDVDQARAAGDDGARDACDFQAELRAPQRVQRDRALLELLIDSAGRALDLIREA